jgi:microcin C transport system substrate-binding protein
MAFIVIATLSISLSVTQSQSALAVSKGVKTNITKTAPKGGTLKLRLSAWPKSLNVHTASDAYLGMLSSFVHASLVDRNQETWDIIPAIAEKWEESDDRKTFTFHLNKKAKFDSGKPITSTDVKFTFDTVYDEKKCVTCVGSRSYIGKIKSITTDGPHKITFVMKNAHFQNLERIGQLPILEMKRFSKGNFNKKYDRVMEGAGPFKYLKSKSKFRKKIVLEKNKNHWMLDYPYFKNRFNFKRVIFKYIQDDTVAFEAFKKQELDIFYFNQGTYKFWDNTKSAPFTNKNAVRLQTPKMIPWTWGGVALNMRKEPTSDINFRKALQLVLNRDVFVKKIYKGHQMPVAGPFAAGSDYSSNSSATKFNPKKASDLLKASGYTKIDSDGILYKEVKGKKQRAEITVMYATKAHDQWITMFKSDAKKVGINVIPRFIDWSAGIKLVDEFNFEGFVIGWSGDPTPAPRQLWHGSTASQKGSSNIPGLNDPSIDSLIDAAPVAFDPQKRIKLFKELEKKILDKQPYLFRWTQKNHYVAFWKDKVNPTETPFFKYSGNNLRSIFHLHWHKAK